jgi:hypothetical protein
LAPASFAGRLALACSALGSAAAPALAEQAFVTSQNSGVSVIDLATLQTTGHFDLSRQGSARHRCDHH